MIKLSKTKNGQILFELQFKMFEFYEILKPEKYMTFSSKNDFFK